MGTPVGGAVVGTVAAAAGGVVAVGVVVRGLARHADRSASYCCSARSSDDLSKLSCVWAREVADRFAAFVASTCRRVARSMSWALSSEASAASTLLPPISLFSVAVCWASVAWRCARVWRATVSSIRASTCPGWTWSPTFTSTSVTVPPSAKPRLWRPPGAMEPDADTASATVPRSTTTVGGPVSLLPEQLTATTVIATMRTRAVAMSRIVRRLPCKPPRPRRDVRAHGTSFFFDNGERLGGYW